MTVNVTKPAINIREKLAELDFDRVPFQKMPAGSVVNVGHDKTDAQIVIDHSSNTYADFSLLVEMTPKSKNSKFLLSADIYKGHGDNPNGGPAFSYVIDGERHYAHPTADHSRIWHYEAPAFVTIDDTITASFTSTASNWRFILQQMHGQVLIAPNTDRPIKFNLGYYGSDTFWVNHSGYSSNLTVGWTNLTVMEIAG